MGPDDVPAGPLAVDTGVFSWIHNQRGRHADFAPLIAGHPLALPFSVVGELKAGAIRGKLGEKRLESLEAGIAACVVIPSDARIVEMWAEIYSRFLGRKGGGLNDIWAAACCISFGLPIVTDDLGDFGQMTVEFPQLRIVHPDL
ncbi:MAG: PIN domain-containing protein [Solirubrobacteraceae bacterium]